MPDIKAILLAIWDKLVELIFKIFKGETGDDNIEFE